MISQLGHGAQGAVYEALDAEQNLRVALKTIGLRTPEDVLRFKNEFRTLRDVRHPNLVRLGELLQEDGRWFYTMELVDGMDLIGYVRGPNAPPPSLPSTTVRLPRPPAPSSGLDAPPLRPMPRGFDEAHLRGSFAQLAAGLQAIHEAGKVHRDLKPSNVLVDRSGRVVVIDFGVVAELADPGLDRGRVIGTIAYMAPEQAEGQSIGAAADWYAFGVLLYEALTGRRPFEGPIEAVLAAKRVADPPSPSALCPEVPADLEALCVRLLSGPSDARPAGAEVLALLESKATARMQSPSNPFVGRIAEMAALERAWDEVRGGRTIAAFLEGESGAGKTTLATHFVERLNQNERRLLVLRGRCDEQERVPYNAFDGVVDGLARHLRRRGPSRLNRLVPPGAAELMRLFPVLRVMREVPAEPDGPVLESDRTRAFAALRALLRRCAARRRIVLVIDDIHWADSDSLALLTELLHEPGAPPILLLATARPGEAGADRAIGAVRCQVRRVPVAGLAPDAAQQLAHSIMVGHGGTVAVDIERVVKETAGHPMFIDELVHHLLDQPHAAQSATLDDALRSRIARQDDSAQRLLALASAAGSPTPHSVFVQAMGVAFEAYVPLVTALRDARLVRVAGMLPSDLLEPYHDRVRESVATRHTPNERSQLHDRLAVAFEAQGAGPEVLLGHLERAGRLADAARNAELAAAAAASAMAFGRAAALYRRAIALGSPPPERRRTLLRALGDVLARAGRPKEAAEAFLEAASTPEIGDDERVDLTRGAAEQYLMGGHLEPGLAAARQVLGAFGIAMPRSSTSALMRLIWSQLRLESRRLSWPRRGAHEVEPRTARLLDTYWSLGAGLGLVESFLSGLFILRGALLALDAGDEARISRALAAAAVLSSGLGRRRRSLELVEACERAAHSDAGGLSLAYGGLARHTFTFFVENDWRSAVAGLEDTRRLFAAAGRREGWEADVVEQFVCWALENLGRLDQIRARVPARIRAAQQAGNRFIEVNFRTYFVHIHLVPDHLDEARRDVEDAIASWPPSSSGFGNQDYLAQRSLTYLALYAGEAEAHGPRLAPRWEQYFKSLLSRVVFLRQDALWLFGALALARNRLREARWAIARLGRIDLPMAQASRLRLCAGLAAAEGDVEGAAVHLRDALRMAERDDTQLVAACVRRRLGGLLAGDEGARMRSEGDAWMAAQGVRNPDRLTAAWLPGFAP